MPKELNKHQMDESFVQSYNDLFPFIMKYCTARANGDVQLAEDCTQDAFFVLYQKHCDGVEIEYPKAFLCRTCDNILLNKTSKISKEQSKRADEELLDELVNESDDFSEIEYDELLEFIKKVLVDKDWELFSLRYISDLSIKEIADKTDMSITSITTRLSRIRKKLQSKLTDY